MTGTFPRKKLEDRWRNNASKKVPK